MPKNLGAWNPGEQAEIERLHKYQALVSILQSMDVDIDFFQEKDMFNNTDWVYAQTIYPWLDQNVAASLVNFAIAMRAASSRPFSDADKQVTALDLVNGTAGILITITGT